MREKHVRQDDRRKRPEAEDVSSNRQLAQGSGGFGFDPDCEPRREVVPTRQGQRTPRPRHLPAVTHQCHSTHQGRRTEKKRKNRPGLAVSGKFENRMTLGSSNPTSRFIPNRTGRQSPRVTCLPVFTAAPSQQPKPEAPQVSTETTWVSKFHSCGGILLSLLRKEGGFPTWMDLENVMPVREWSQTQKDIHCLIPLTGGPLEESDSQTRSRWWGQGLGERMGSQRFTGQFRSREMRKLWRWWRQ